MSTPNLDDLREAREELDAVIEEVRQVEGFSQFLTAPTFEHVAAAAARRPLVYLAAADTGGLALLVRDGEVAHVDLPDLAAGSLRERVDVYLHRHETFRRNIDSPNAEGLWRDWTDHLDQVTGWLWRVAMGPVIDRLSLDNVDAEVALVACGLLALLPLHAAWTDDPARPTGRRYAIDHAVWTCTANAQALAVCQEAADVIEVRRSVVVADPEPGDRGNKPLPAIRTMSPVVKALVPEGPDELHGTAATKAAVHEALCEADLLHLGCHGRADLQDPLGSCVVLGDGLLTLDEIMRMRLRVRLAVLAACETAMVGPELPDEVVSLPTGLVQAGAAAVIASMWGCDELATALALTDFYRRWRDGSPAVALTGAQRWLRDATREELQQSWEQAIDHGASWLPESVGDALLTRVLLDPPSDREPRPWSGAETWAALTYTGA
jgi:hypothetical protein